MLANDSNLAIEPAEEKIILPAREKIQEPSGVYQTVLPGNIGHIVAFNSDHTFQLQESFANDSTIVITGNWSPSNGYIWLYKDQVVRARYRWKGKQLEYYNPAQKKGFPMNPMQDIATNTTWQKKKDEGISFFGIGNEPFWNVSIDKNDSLSFRLADWKESLKTVVVKKQSGDSLLYHSGDSIHLTILPHFCSDGMSDNVYRNSVKIQYKKEVFRGCGMRY